MSNGLCKLYLKPRKEESLLRFHPWIFSGAVASASGRAEDGDLVEVYDAGGRFMGTGHYQAGSITVRILSFRPATIDHSFWMERLGAAYGVRRALGLCADDNDTFRLVYGEGDMLPGLIVDVYGSMAVVQAHSVGMHRSRMAVAAALKETLGDGLRCVYYKSEGTLPPRMASSGENAFLLGEAPEEAIAVEKGLRFHVDWQKGQKTGFFVDQRENRALLEGYARGRQVLNMFCYTGGFSVYAMRGDAAAVHSVDSSARAVGLTERNVELNFPGDARHRAFAADAFEFLGGMPGGYDLIALDPPAFAKRREVLRNALLGYRKLNALAMEKIAAGGILFTFSCSQVVSRNDFRLAIFSAAAQTGRHVRILHQLTQPADHPVSIYHPEGEYLKGLVVLVE
ncbi:MAG: class I SAM-dependent rRNA methyltransferase [Tannerella sp.]|nr:class I SAM-dependent rRNA methyltransferase [Tannerella sp.]